jgi:hypothetical protein
MKPIAIAIIVLASTCTDLAILAAGVWLTFFLGHSFWWWILVIVLSWGETVASYKFVNAVNGAQITMSGESE